VHIGTSLGISPREPITHSVEVVQNAENLGFDSAWIADVQLSMKDCYTAMPLMAVATDKILIGTGVTNPITRDPTTIANSFTALNEISEGRAICGIGTGWTGVYSIGKKPSTIANLERSINDIHTLTEGGEIMGPHGLDYRLTTHNGRVKIFVAANQPRILRMCGRVADGVIMMGGANEEFTKWQIDLVKEGAAEVGRDIKDITLHLWAAIGMNEDKVQGREDVSHWAASQAETFSKWKQTPEFLEKWRPDFTAASEAYDRLEHMSSHASHKGVLSPEFIDWVSFTGGPEECRDQIKKLQALGIDGVTLAFRAGAGGRLARMQELSREIIEHFK
jgi:5,10-methylenetetrahydromethanopterin reductase